MHRHRVWSIGCSPRNALQFLWELNTEVTCQVGRCFNKHEAQQIKVQDWQLAAKMVPCNFTSTWSTGRGEKAGERCEQIVQGLEAGSAAREMALISSKSRSCRSAVTPATVGSPVQRTHKIKAAVCVCPRRTTRL